MTRFSLFFLSAIWTSIASIPACSNDTTPNPAESTQPPSSPANDTQSAPADNSTGRPEPSAPESNSQPPTTQTQTANPCPSGMVLIDGGVFKMGAPYSVKPESDYYLHTVALKSFCLDLTEVTVANYKECVENKSCTKPHSNGFSCTFDIPTKLNHPINCVDYQQAKQACETFGKRLPSEEEWEYAARGGQEGRTYSWGESEPSRTLSCYDHPGTCAVDAHPPGAYGLLGMTGNVWEWTSSPYVKYAGWNPVGEWRVYRGGSYSRRFPKWMKTWVRNRFRPGEWGAHLGFRCASDVESNCPTGTSPQENNPTRCLFPGEKLPKTSQTTSQGTWNDNSPPPVVTRSPHFDQDCLRHKPATPVAYELKGSSFAQRQKLKANLGCANRDVGSDFNSVCCPQ